MSETKKIYSAMLKALQEVDAIGKNKQNLQQKFMYRGVDDAMNELHGVFSRCGIFCVPEVLEQLREERQTKGGGNLIYSILKVRFTFYADDGSSVSSVVVGEGMDSGDKASNKALSVAFKYAVFQVFCIPTESIDPDSETPPQSYKKENENSLHDEKQQKNLSPEQKEYIRLSRYINPKDGKPFFNGQYIQDMDLQIRNGRPIIQCINELKQELSKNGIYTNSPNGNF